MKITEDIINHNALRLIAEIIGEPCEYMESEDAVASVVCEVKGVVEMARVMKEVLKV